MCSGTGRYGKPDGLEVLDKNLRMFENVFRYAGDVEKFINFDSGASLFRNADIPDTTYGFSKYTIARSVDAVENGINLRVYGSSEQQKKALDSLQPILETTLTRNQSLSLEID